MNLTEQEPPLKDKTRAAFLSIFIWATAASNYPVSITIHSTATARRQPTINALLAY